jgi:hypothetical protein
VIRRHQPLVCCAFSFCWDAWFADHPAGLVQGAPPRQLQALIDSVAAGCGLHLITFKYF